MKQLLISFAFIVLMGACGQDVSKKKVLASIKTNDGFIPDAETAKKIAEAVWFPIYGEAIYDEKPYQTKLENGIWIVEGTLKSELGGVAYIEIQKSDGKVLKVELEYVKSFFSQQFGPQFSVAHLQTLKHFVNGAEIPLEQICGDIKQRTQVEVRIQLMHYLFGIAKADGHVADIEIQILRRIASLLDIPNADFESVKNMFYRDVNSDYTVLGIESSATEDEIKKAYRQMAIRYHPDKVAAMGDEYQKGAQEKFQKIQEAYENIKKQRGMN